MKRITIGTLLLATFLLLFLSGCAGPAATTDLPEGVSDRDAPTKATEVVVSTDLGAKEVFKQTSRVLISSGYAIENSSSTLLNITTKKIGADPNGILAGTPKHRISVVVRENPTEVVLSGSKFGAGVQSPIQKFGQTNSPRRLAWKQLVTVGYKVSERVNGEISYSK